MRERHSRDTFKEAFGKLVHSIHLKNRMSLIQADQVGSPDFRYLTCFFIFRGPNYLGTWVRTRLEPVARFSEGKLFTEPRIVRSMPKTQPCKYICAESKLEELLPRRYSAIQSPVGSRSLDLLVLSLAGPASQASAVTAAPGFELCAEGGSRGRPARATARRVPSRPGFPRPGISRSTWRRAFINGALALFWKTCRAAGPHCASSQKTESTASEFTSFT